MKYVNQLMAVVLMVIACICAFLSVEKEKA